MKTNNRVGLRSEKKYIELIVPRMKGKPLLKDPSVYRD